MHYRKFFYLLLILGIFQSYCAVSQQNDQKFEREISIELEDFPPGALELAQPILKKSKKIRFYKEISENKHFYEFKAFFRGEYISVKFDSAGHLFDIEVLKNYKDLPANIQENVRQHFEENYKKHRFLRIQIQYNRERELEEGILEIDDDEEFIEEFLEKDEEDLIIKYEIEAETVDKNNERGFYEFLFNRLGQLENRRAIISRADDNVLY